MNIFTVLSTGNSNLHEPSMSAMFAYLLNPSQDHGLGRTVLNSFLKLSNTNGMYQDFIDKRNIKFEIDLEVPYADKEKKNYIDIQIKILDSSSYKELHRIIIENKIRKGAANPKQLSSYYDAVINDTTNDDPFLSDKSELTKDELSVIFLTPMPNKGLQEEFNNLHSKHKAWVYWNNEDTEKTTIVDLIQDILKLEQKAIIPPINEYMKHTLKAFTYFIIKTIDISSGKNRAGEDIGDEVKTEKITINDESFTILLRDSGQIQLFDEKDDKVTARPLLRRFLDEHGIQEEKGKKNTRYFGKQIFSYLESK